MPTYNKLVRDRIPEIIANNGKTCTTRILDEAAYHEELRLKLSEELREYMEAEDNKSALEELADILELLHALSSVHGFNAAQLETIRAEKSAQRGGFNERIYLEAVQEA
ncbi:nucleoside triphosphate pyrophosphohydrolase [Paenibacillus sp. CF384]|uniref:nucleoside triphosphate pyrophosphohydrolase n=1 Tax=Paenibacillus sp. CF384 TaxID=1884382 RepID=UPI000897D337|nr:nucleoside triphosphate pyrophosphohydrolase [Paenibacillus sp. CF384]SDX97109.1 Predicted house-cleaning noncanonical NTP pyrophosphatase, all-alpha NTP-PPase (MazG) superfamily [Paenibacillus sp. CF384]